VFLSSQRQLPAAWPSPWDQRNLKGRYFGPYSERPAPSLKASVCLQKAFSSRSAKTATTQPHQTPAPNIQIKSLQGGLCWALVDEQGVREDVRIPSLFLEGAGNAAGGIELGQAMEHAAEQLDFERAGGELRDQMGVMRRVAQDQSRGLDTSRQCGYRLLRPLSPACLCACGDGAPRAGCWGTEIPLFPGSL